MGFFKTILEDLISRQTTFDSFVRVWKGKVYSVANAQLIYDGKHERLYKHSSGDYFLVWMPMYEDFGYEIYNKKGAINMLQSRIINAHKQKQIMPILEAEFGITLEL